MRVKKLETMAKVMAMKALFALIAVILVVGTYHSLPAWTKALVVVLVPSLTAGAAWRTLATRPDQAGLSATVSRVPWWAWLIVGALNYWAIKLLYRAFVWDYHRHPTQNLIGLGLMVLLVLVLVIGAYADPERLIERSQRTKTDLVYGPDAAALHDDYQIDVGSLNEQWTKELIAQRAAENERRLADEKAERKRVKKRLKKYKKRLAAEAKKAKE